MRSSPLEKDLERKCCEYAALDGWLSVKLDRVGRSWPDRLFVGSEGRTLMVEFKRLGLKPRKSQARMHEKLRGLGHEVYVVDNYEDFLKLLGET